MDTQKRWLALITLGLFLLALPVTLLADEPEPDKKDSKIIIVHDGDEEVVIEMEEIHEIMAEAMEGLDEAMS